jgi:steroid delta-isomerase
MELEGRVRTAGLEAACAMRAIPIDADGVVIETLDVMSFDEQGRITRMRAYWSPDTIRQE